MNETVEILSTLRDIEIRTNRKVESLMQGNYHSIFKGRGIEFADVREYLPGDDIRTIDWNITARMNHPYVREFIEERNLLVYIFVDVSGSNYFGSEKEKRRASIELTASIIFSALKNNDKVGLVLFTKDIEKFVKPKAGRKHALSMIHTMLAHQPKDRATNLSLVLKKVGNLLKQRSIVFLLSDFLDSGYEKQMAILNRRHDVIAINLRDSREEEIPDVGYLMVEDAENDEQFLVNTSDEEFRQEYRRKVLEQNDILSKNMHSLGIDMVHLHANEDSIVPLQRLFAIRQRRRK